MTEKSLWGELPTRDLVRTPYQILHEQGALLGEMTGDLLVGKVQRRTNADGIHLALSIVAPDLDNYAYTVLHVKHGIEIYPVFVGDEEHAFTRDMVKCENEDEFVQALGRSLSSEQVKKVIRGLLSQVKFN